MYKVAAVAMSIAAFTVLAPGAGPAVAKGGSSAAWPARYALPTHPGRVVSQSSSTAVVRSIDTAWAVEHKLDRMYVNRRGCTRRLAVNKPRAYLCHNKATGKTDEIVFTFAALDRTPTDPTRSQTNAYLFKG